MPVPSKKEALKNTQVTYAIVDIETTGGYAAANGITEIAIRIFDGEKITEHFETLLNPLKSIPRYIQAFTGITDEMVQDAPCFEEVAETVFTLLQGNVFVAHNVNFDYSFIKTNLDACGYTWQAKKLCTVRLARQLLPGYPSYSLGNICQSLGIGLENRHRAGGDADATVLLFDRILKADADGHVAKSLARNSKESILPPNVPKAHFEALPASPGVYYFHDIKGKVIYVGKARNIRWRVNSHFSNNSAGRQKQNFMRNIYAISFQPTATELMASVLESTEIKRLWPQFNTSQKRAEDAFGIFLYEDRRGYLRLAIEKKRKLSQPIATFYYRIDAFSALKSLVEEFGLCPKFCFIQTDDTECVGHLPNNCTHLEDPDQYNRRVMEARGRLATRPSFLLLDKGKTSEDRSCIMVVNGNFYGMGYVPQALSPLNQETVTQFIQPYKENSFINALLMNHASSFPERMHVLA